MITLRIEELEYRFQNLNEVLSFILAILSIAALGVKNLISYGVLQGFPITPLFLLVFVGFPIIAAVLAIVPHELAHRQVARRYGCLSRFSVSFTGFLATLIINILPAPFIVFFAGYTLISCIFTARDARVDGVTAAAGPATNIIISILSYLIYKIVGEYTLLGYLFSFIANFNAVVAFFNLLPFWVLDGLKILRWNVVVWSILLLMSLIMLVITPLR